MSGNDESETTCGYCGKVYNPYIRDRFWSGTFVVPDDDGGTKTVDTLCNEHHRQFVREA
ncbi:hypothetical protein [Natrarchaeobius oligotrophus]|uniref:hypothetical protein n=1 Tax=Natrarchaeobius oligotrophus TaxID=3455743 RepID=UPI001404BC11|nr:hypothetical protein [Natrarchaeobius chitinivorans]